MQYADKSEDGSVFSLHSAKIDWIVECYYDTAIINIYVFMIPMRRIDMEYTETLRILNKI